MLMLTLLRRGQLIEVPKPEDAVRYLASEAAPSDRRLLLGRPEKVRAQIEEVAREYGAAEVMVVTITYDHAARRRSYELLLSPSA